MLYRNYDQPARPLPRIRPRKGFSSLPGSEQLVVIAIIGVALLVLWPGLLESGRMRSAAEIKQALMPRKPTSIVQFTKRLKEHYGLGWLIDERATAERSARLLLSSLQVGSILGAAVAGRQAKLGRHQRAVPLCFAAAGERKHPKIRARAALMD